jgi:hypothetical protein
MAAEKLTGNAPNRRSVEALFRELREAAGHWTTEGIRELDAKADAMEKAILRRNAKFVALKSKVKRLQETHERARGNKRLAITQVEREYRAKGLTKEVLKKIAALVARFNNGARQ